MILVDSSVLVTAQRRPDFGLYAKLSSIDAAYCGAVEAELLSGVRTPTEKARTEAILGALNRIDTPEEVWPLAGRFLQLTGQAGLRVPFPDALIAAVAFRHGAELWARDNHFHLLQTLVPDLRLFTEP